MAAPSSAPAGTRMSLSSCEAIAEDELRLNPNNVPLLPLRDIVAFPSVVIPIPIGRESSIKLVREAVEKKESIALFTQKDASVDNPDFDDLYHIGTVARILKVVDMPDDSTTIIVQPRSTVRLVKITRRRGFLKGKIEPYAETIPETNDEEMVGALMAIQEAFAKVLEAMPPEEARELKFGYDNISNHLSGVNYLICHLPISAELKQKLLEMNDFKQRALSLSEHLGVMARLMKIKSDIQSRTRDELTKQQRDHFLQQELQSIKDELGISEDEEELNELEERAASKVWSEDVAKHFSREMRKLERFNPQSPDYSIQYTYLDTFLSLPWDTYRDGDISLDQVESTLNEDHYGLEKVKDRIIEQMAVMSQRGDNKSSIICLYGPPGVGKTSLGKSVARALDREYVRISLGGVSDESEVRGHRRTYLGAMPGRIISSLTKLGTSNPVVVLDEVDKLSRDYKGDPASALLELLDPEQNNAFHDNYLDVDYDLSKVLFIATANTLSTVSRPLLDRMETIEITGYTAEEKVEIAHRHLVPKMLERHGFKPGEIKFSPEALRAIIDNYTSESGVRTLEKKIAAVLRKVARLKLQKHPYPQCVEPSDLRTLIGPQEVFPDKYETSDCCVGVVTGLAWTSVGGEILFIESSVSEEGKEGKLTLTGNLGDVMKESAILARQYLKANAKALGLDADTVAKSDVHIHVPEGAIPKDGPSAGITMATSLASAFTGRKVRSRLAMTGEITLRGKLLPVGGIKEKILAAKRAGITDIVLCPLNRKDVEEIEPRYLDGVTFHYMSTIAEVLDFALL